jgi:hypothetical protein
MANHKRETPLTDDEKKARNRKYQETRRHKTNNAYARAYRRTGERVIEHFKSHNRALWNQWLEEELSKVESKGYKPMGNGLAEGGKNSIACDHPERVIIAFDTGCSICGNVLGAVQIEEQDRDFLNARFEV